jgi:8-oxo-dGTP pyrophosphatase MutT (NUDIX family)
MGTFRVLRTTRAAEVGFLAVDEVEIEAPDGATIRRTVVRHPGAVVIVPVESNSDATGPTAVLVRQYRAAVDEHVLEVPAGKRDVEGEPPATTAARELEEELGLHAGRLVKLAEFFNTPGFCDERSHLFVALDLRVAERAAPTSPEERDMTVERVALADVEALIAAGTLHDAKTILGLLLARQYLAGALTGSEVNP